MSSDIWTRCGGRSNAKRMRRRAWRVVESQHQISTRKLVDSLEEQALLEDLLEQVKPPATAKGLHYLLFTPFRYPPLRHGSRFGRQHERGIWYGSEAKRTAFAEVAYYRLLFVEGSEAKLTPLTLEFTLFRAQLRSSRAIDLTVAPFSEFKAQLVSTSSYAATQALGTAMRNDQIELFRFVSARDPEGGANIALLSPTAFEKKTPFDDQQWSCLVTEDAVELNKKGLSAPPFVFARRVFEVDGRLPRATG